MIDGDNNTVVEYAYDSWGRQISCTCTRANTMGIQKQVCAKPSRHRGEEEQGGRKESI